MAKPDKTICKKCVEKRMSNGWTELDETAWEEADLHYCCALKFGHSVNADVPITCFYYLEYIVHSQKVIPNETD